VRRSAPRRWGEQHGWPSPGGSPAGPRGLPSVAAARLAGRRLTPDLCRRSPPAGDRWHIRQPVLAARFTAVLPRGSSGDTRRARRNRQGDGDTAEGSVFGVRRPRGWSPGAEGPVWPLEVPLRGAVAHRLRPVGISDQARSVTAGAGLAFRVPGTLIGRPSPNEPAAVVHRVSVKGKLAALVPSGPLTGGRWCARESSRARASCWLASRAVRGRYVVLSSGVVKPARMSQV
jgi:hypothetical protein